MENVNNYYIAYIQQSWAVTIAAMGNAATETLVSGFMMQICAQFEILEERFMQMPSILDEMRINGKPIHEILIAEKKIIVTLVRHHLTIIE